MLDAFLLLDLGDDFKNPKDVLAFITQRMKEQEKYKDSIVQRDRCVRVTYAGDFHIDIVPAKPTDGETVMIPSKKEGEWVETNPKGFMNWCADVNRQSNGMFTRVTKFVKYWRDISLGESTAPKSILLTTLVGLKMIGSSSDAESLVCTLEAITSSIDDLLVDDEPYVENPSLEGENLARDWDKDKFDIFKGKIERFATKARDALDEEDKDKSIKKWRDIFGEAFPLSLSEAAEMARDVLAGRVFVNSKGQLTREPAFPIQPHRYYGEHKE